MKKHKILLIIPAYNEQENILNVVKAVQSNKNVDYIIINDGSTDSTGVICDKYELKHIDLIHNLGIGGAIQTGYKYAYENDYDIAIQFDGDGQHDIKYVDMLIKPIIEQNIDMVIGSRFIDDISKFKSTKIRRLGINTISFFIKLFTGVKIYDTTSGFRACNKKTIEYFSKNYPSEYPEPVSTVTLLKQKYKVIEVPVEMKERTAGVSSIRTWKSIYYMINVIFSIFIISLRRYK